MPGSPVCFQQLVPIAIVLRDPSLQGFSGIQISRKVVPPKDCWFKKTRPYFLLQQWPGAYHKQRLSRNFYFGIKIWSTTFDWGLTKFSYFEKDFTGKGAVSTYWNNNSKTHLFSAIYLDSLQGGCKKQLKYSPKNGGLMVIYHSIKSKITNKTKSKLKNLYGSLVIPNHPQGSAKNHQQNKSKVIGATGHFTSSTPLPVRRRTHHGSQWGTATQLRIPLSCWKKFGLNEKTLLTFHVYIGCFCFCFVFQEWLLININIK